MATNTQNPQSWEILGLEPDCTKEQIKTRWRKLVKENHPDHGGSENDFLILHQAYREALYLADLKAATKTRSVSYEETSGTTQNNYTRYRAHEPAYETAYMEEQNRKTERSWVGLVRAITVLIWTTTSLVTSVLIGEKYTLSTTQTATLILLSLIIPFLSDRILGRWWAGVAGWISIWIVLLGWGYAIPWT